MEHIKSQYHKLFSENAKVNITDGWFWLVSGLCHALEQYCCGNALRQRLQITRIEQRLGTLCIHYHGGDQATEKIICAVQLASTRVCQLCGSTENAGGTYGTMLYTICEKCWKLDEQFHGHHLASHEFSEKSLQIFHSGLDVMPDSWFKKHMGVLV